MWVHVHVPSTCIDGNTSGIVFNFNLSLSLSLSLSLFQVIFDNGTTNTVTEEFIYSLNEPLPRRVKDKLKVCNTPCNAMQDNKNNTCTCTILYMYLVNCRK